MNRMVITFAIVIIVISIIFISLMEKELSHTPKLEEKYETSLTSEPLPENEFTTFHFEAVLDVRMSKECHVGDVLYVTRVDNKTFYLECGTMRDINK